jgi:hypothetical protein
MKKLHFFLVLLVVLQTSFVSAQKVSNITYHQEQNTIIVSYDLETKTLCKVNLYVSTNGGTTWQGPLTKVSGDVGAKIATGSHSITWKVLEEFEELRGDKIQFQVRAAGDSIETVVIGTQEWTKKNLNVSKYKNGDIIPEVKNPEEWASLTTGAWCYCNNNIKNGAIYGKLYNWYAVNDPRGLAPEGFHIPTETEMGMVNNGLNLKDPTRFAGLPGGYRDGDGVFYSGGGGTWWSFFEYNALDALSRTLVWSRTQLYAAGYTFTSNDGKKSGFSVRCVKD